MTIRDNLGTVAAADAPDVITAAHDWTGALAANGLVEPIFMTQCRRKTHFPSYTHDAFSYGTAVKKLYGVPVAVENIGLGRQHEAGEGPHDLLAARVRGRGPSR